MAYRSGGIGVGIGTLGRLAVLPDRRLPHVVTALGDSRVAAVYLDPHRMNRGSWSPLNWANTLLGQRMTIDATFGVSGNRTDQFLARLPAAIATGAGLLYVQGGINNIGQVASGSPAFTYVHATTGEVVTIDTVAETAMRDLRLIADSARRAGMTVVIENEIGGTPIDSPEKITALNELRALLADYGAQTPGIFVHDAYATVMQPGSATPAFRPGCSYDGIHENARGGFRHGQSLARLLDRIVPPRGILSSSVIDTPAHGRRQLLANHLFATTAGGAGGNGVTGAVPAAWGAAMEGGGSAALSVVTNPDGVGNGVQAAIDFAGPGTFRFSQALEGDGAGQYNPVVHVGDVVEGFALVEIVGTPSCLSTVQMDIAAASDGGATTVTNSIDLAGPVGPQHQGVDGAALLTLRTRPIVVPPSTGPGPYLFVAIRAMAFEAGAATVIVRQAGLRRRTG